MTEHDCNGDQSYASQNQFEDFSRRGTLKRLLAERISRYFLLQPQQSTSLSFKTLNSKISISFPDRGRRGSRQAVLLKLFSLLAFLGVQRLDSNTIKIYGLDDLIR